jgi:hypothetical protein
MHRGRLPAFRCRHDRVDGLQRLSGRTASDAKTPSPIMSPTPNGRGPRSRGTRAHYTRLLHPGQPTRDYDGTYPYNSINGVDGRTPAQISR